MQTFIQSDLTEIKKDPTNIFQQKTKQFLAKSNVLFNKSEKHNLIYMNPRSPKLYGLIKNHKENAPIRPVVSYINSPTHKLSTNVNSIFKNLTKFEPKHTIKNSIQLTKLLEKVEIPENCILVSFDVSNMFSNIPTKECKPLFLNLLDKSHSNILVKNELMSALDLCLSQNYCQYNNKFYTQNSGLAMGAPLSPLLADIFMSNLEEDILNSNLAKTHIKFWYRYVDDVLACFTGTRRQLDIFLTHVNSLHPNIKFTVEIEEDNKINFLDLTLTRNINKINFNIFRKPTFTDTTISNHSLSPNSHKLAAYHSMINRALLLPLSETNLKMELNTIKRIALNNGFEEKTIENLINKKQQKIAYNSIYPHTDYYHTSKFTSLTYFGEISEKIANILSRHNLKVSFKASPKLSHILFNAKDRTDPLKQPGVYKLKCPDCNAFYIGQTGRSFNIRYHEHLRSFRLQKTDSTFSNHILESSHTFPNLSDINILHVQEKSFKLNLLESLEIFKATEIPSNNLLNDQLDLYRTPLFNVFKSN